MRLHSLIFSAVVGALKLKLAYDPKVRNVIAQVGAPCLALDDMDSAAIVAHVEDLLARRAELRESLAARVEPLRVKALESARLAADLLAGRALKEKR